MVLEPPAQHVAQMQALRGILTDHEITPGHAQKCCSSPNSGALRASGYSVDEG